MPAILTPAFFVRHDPFRTVALTTTLITNDFAKKHDQYEGISQ